eukprot:9228453-Karenia_brevis.AAC.1
MRTSMCSGLNGVKQVLIKPNGTKRSTSKRRSLQSCGVTLSIGARMKRTTTPPQDLFQQGPAG